MSRQRPIVPLRDGDPVILPSLLLCDFGNLAREVRALERAGCGGLHLDVMDGRFVPNLTYGMPIVEAVRRDTDLPLDVHLMIEEPQRYVQGFHDAGADLLTVHVEAVEDPAEVLASIRALGMQAGLALNPGTPLAAVEPHVAECDLILVMSVEAGFGGQSFQPVALEKLRRLRNVCPAGTRLEVDGGINARTIGECASAGAELFVVGSAIFRSTDYGEVVSELSRLADTAGE